MRVRISEAARREATLARIAFRDRDPSTVARFRVRMKEATAQLAQYPETGPVDTDGSRRLLLLPFPYSLVYYIEGGEVVVVAVAHTSQEPGYWSHR